MASESWPAAPFEWTFTPVGAAPLDLAVFAADLDAAVVAARYVLGCLLATLLR